MASIFIGPHPGLVLVNSQPNRNIGIIQVSFLPDTTQGFIITGFRMAVAARHAIDYSLSNYKYLYVYGTDLVEMVVAGSIYTVVNCNTKNSIMTFLQFIDRNIVSGFGNPTVDILLNGAPFRGILVNAELGQLQQPYEFNFALTIKGVFL